MNKTILEPLKEEISANRAEIKDSFFPLVRGGMWSFIPVYIAYLLFKEWGQEFPSILWLVPLVFPPLLFLQGAVKLLYPAKYIFTEKALEERSGTPKKVKWRNVDN